MEREAAGETRWTDLPIVCPHCGNHGQEDRPWTVNAWTPFKIVEEVIRSWIFSAEIDGEGNLFLRGDSNSDDVDWESGRGMRFECMQCFGEFPLPENAKVEIE